MALTSKLLRQILEISFFILLSFEFEKNRVRHPPRLRNTPPPQLMRQDLLHRYHCPVGRLDVRRRQKLPTEIAPGGVVGEVGLELFGCHTVYFSPLCIFPGL